MAGSILDVDLKRPEVMSVLDATGVWKSSQFVSLAVRDRLSLWHDLEVAELQGSFMRLVQATVPVLNIRRSH
jgi:hypothetical protein